MKTKSKMFALLLVLICAFVCCLLLAACDDEPGNTPGGTPGNTPGDNTDNEPQTATYSVTVTCDDSELDLTGITAVWKSGSTTKGSSALSATGTASVTLEKGNYTVTLTGAALVDYTFSDASVTESNTTATIALTKKGPASVSYSVAVTTNDSSLDLTTIGVQWKVGSDIKASAVLDASGNASTTLVEGNYTVTLVILSKADYYQFTDATVTADNTTANITLTAVKRDVVVNVVGEVELPTANVSVQVKVDGENFGSPVAVVEGKATVAVPFTGEYTVELVHEYDYFAGNVATSESEDNGSIEITVSLQEIEYTVNVVVPAELDVADLSVTLLDSDGEPVEDATELSIEGDSILGYHVTVEVLAGTYTVQINGLNASDYNYDEVTLDIDNRSQTVTISESFYTAVAGAQNATNIGTFADSNEVKRVKLSGVTVNQYYSVMLSSDSADEGAESDFNLHNFTISYNGTDSMVGKYTLENELDSFIVITIASGKLELTVTADDTFTEEVKISVQEYEVIDKTLEVGEEKEIYITNTYDFVAPTADAYLITVEAIGLARNEFQINMDEGSVIGKDSNSSLFTYEFYASANEPLAIGVYVYARGTLKVTIDKTYGDIVLDQTSTVKLGTYSQNVKSTFKVPYKGIYRLEITSGNVTPSQIVVSVEGKNPIIDSDHNSLIAEFTSEIGESYINFTNFSGTDLVDVEVNFVVTLVKDIGNILPVNGSNTANIGGVDAPAKLVLDGVESGVTYRLLVQWSQPFTKTNVITLTYNGEQYSMPLVGDSESEYYNYFYVEFVAVEGVYDIEINTPGTYVKGVLVKLQEIETIPGPQVGEKTEEVVIGKQKENATELTFSADFVAGGTYTLRLTPSGMATMVASWMLVYDSTGSEIAFTQVGSVWEATFTANKDTTNVKVYHADPYFSMQAFATIEIVAANVPTGPVGPKVGDTVMVTPGDSEANAAVIAFDSDFVEGMKYTIALDGTEIGVANNWKFVVMYNGKKIADDVQGSALTFSFTAVSGGELKVYCTEHKNMFGNADADLFAMPFTITNVEEGEEAPAGLTVGGTYVLAKEDVGDSYPTMPFMMGGTPIPLVGLTAGTRYTITIAPGAVGDYGKTFYYNDDDLSSSNKTQILNFSFTFTYTEGMAIRILVPFGGSELNADLTLTLAAA